MSKVFKKVSVALFTLLLAFSLVVPVNSTKDVQRKESIQNLELNEVWYDQNGNEISTEVETVVVYDSRTEQIKTRGPAMSSDYYMIYNHYVTLRTTTPEYSILTSINVGITIRVDFYKNGTIKKIGTPEYYSTTLVGLAGNPTLVKSISTSKLSSTKYSVTPRIQITSIPKSPVYAGTVNKQT